MQSPAKIVATIGPACEKQATLEKMIRAGLSVARLNFSHGLHERHAKNARIIRRAAKKVGRYVGIMQDLCGPKIRTGPLEQGSIELVPGRTLTLTTRDVPGDASLVSVNYKQLPGELREGDTLRLSDGLLELTVHKIERQDIHCEVVIGGILGERKGISVPAGRLSISAVTDRDLKDLEFGLSLGVDYVALSFVASEKDISKVRRIIADAGSHAGVIAKIERPEALDNLDAILKEADGVMVARGDLGVEIPPERVPVQQKRIIRAAMSANVPVITATQMLESMTDHNLPTRAEASDVANAILDGSDAVMLSAETAVGHYPVEAVTMMTRIGQAVYENMRSSRIDQPLKEVGDAADLEASDMTRATCWSASEAVRAIGAKGLCAFTQSGYTALAASRHVRRVPIYALSPNENALRRCTLYRGVMPIKARSLKVIDRVPEEVDRIVLEKKLAKKGDPIVIVFGAPLLAQGTTNMVKVHYVE